MHAQCLFKQKRQRIIVSSIAIWLRRFGGLFLTGLIGTGFSLVLFWICLKLGQWLWGEEEKNCYRSALSWLLFGQYGRKGIAADSGNNHRQDQVLYCLLGFSPPHFPRNFSWCYCFQLEGDCSIFILTFVSGFVLLFLCCFGWACFIALVLLCGLTV